MLLNSYLKQTNVKTNIKSRKKKKDFLLKNTLLFSTLFLMSCNSINKKDEIKPIEEGVYDIQQNQSITEIVDGKETTFYDEILKIEDQEQNQNLGLNKNHPKIDVNTKSDDMSNNSIIVPKTKFKSKITYHKYICKGNKEKNLFFYYLYELNDKTNNLDLVSVNYKLDQVDGVHLKLQNKNVKQEKNSSEENLIFKQNSLRDDINGYYQWEISTDRKQGSLSLISQKTGKTIPIFSKCDISSRF